MGPFTSSSPGAWALVNLCTAVKAGDIGSADWSNQGSTEQESLAFRESRACRGLYCTVPPWVVEELSFWLFVVCQMEGWSKEIKRMKTTDVPNLYHCRAFASRILGWRSVWVRLFLNIMHWCQSLGENDSNDCYMLHYEMKHWNLIIRI